MQTVRTHITNLFANKCLILCVLMCVFFLYVSIMPNVLKFRNSSSCWKQTNMITELLSLDASTFIMNRSFNNHLSYITHIPIICCIIILNCTTQKQLLENPIFKLTVNCAPCTCFFKYLELFRLKLSMYICHCICILSLSTIDILLHFLSMILLYMLKIFSFQTMIWMG